MKPRRMRRNATDRYSGVREAVTFEEAISAARAINRRVRREWDLASSAAREAHLRSLMGLPAVRGLSDDEART
jgi:hypothetical protein